MNECLLMIIVTPALEDSLVDWLLERDEIKEFSSMHIHGHGGHHGQLSLAEQVSGRQRKVMFHVHLAEAHLRPLLEKLRLDFNGTGLHYWITPLVETGYL